jgi:asparagine synthase (glutamine-hydrolysing)
MGKLATILQVGRTFGVRDGALRLGYELQRGSGVMSRRMRSVEGWSSWELNRIAPGFSGEDLLAARRDGTRPFFFADAPALGKGIREIVCADGERSIIEEAKNILAGSLPFFGRLWFACGFPPQWLRNPATGQQVSQQRPWTTMRFASPAYGDLKFILEPSRFLFVYPLVRAYALSGDEQYAEAFWIAIEDWARNSPPMAGPLWICGQECSLRILAWSFGLYAFIHAAATSAERVALLTRMIAAHVWRIRTTLSYARSQRSNHLVSEAAGLWTAGTLYPELKGACAWQNLGARLLREAVLDQITPQGAPQQHSFNYQRMVLHLVLWTLRLAEIHRAALDQDISARAHAALDFMRACVDPVSGHAPKYGSDDGSLILPLTLCDYGDYRPLLQLGAAVLGRPDLPPGPWDEAALWLCGDLGQVPQASKKNETPRVSASTSVETGYHRLGDENSWALIRAGRYARRPVQADQLHVDLWWRGFNVARDAGTYLYNGEPPWNNGFSRTLVHNTITVDGRDQMRRAGRFLWVDWAQASGESYSSAKGICADRFEGEHDGYRRFGVRHRRMVQWLEDAGWVIVDDVLGNDVLADDELGAGEHEVRLHWLAADLPFEVSHSPFQVVFAATDADFRWSFFASAPGNAAVIRAGESSSPEVAGADAKLLGWESPTYGELRPAVSLVYQIRAPLPVRLVSVILANEECRVEIEEKKPEEKELIVRRRESEIYRVNFAADSRYRATPGGRKATVRQG